MSDLPIREDVKKSGLSEEIFDWIESVVFSVFVVVLIFTFLLRPVGVDGDSMVPTLHNEDRLIVTHLFYTPQHGDIVVVNSPGLGKPIVKRVIGLPGDKVNIDFEQHKVYVNDAELAEPYINEPTARKEDTQFPLTVKDGTIFVMGDNRNYSTDSRSSLVGLVDMNNIVGKAIFRLFPFSSAGFIK